MKIQGILEEFKEETSFTIKGKLYLRQIITVIAINNQKLFIELRGNTIKRVRAMKIQAGDEVFVDIEFLGSQKGNRYFNNIIAKSIGYDY
jgi:hypothetical protein